MENFTPEGWLVFSGKQEERLSVESKDGRRGIGLGDVLGLSGSTYTPEEHFGIWVAWENISRIFNSVFEKPG